MLTVDPTLYDRALNFHASKKRPSISDRSRPVKRSMPMLLAVSYSRVRPEQLLRAHATV